MKKTTRETRLEALLGGAYDLQEGNWIKASCSTIATQPMMRYVPTIVTGLPMRQVPRISWRLLLNGLGLRKSQKVFAVGFAKCATTSLHALFLSLGLPSFHGIGWRSCNSIRLLRTFDCFSDGIPKDLAKLDRLFPGSKFVLQVRDLQSWVYSQLGHIERNKKRGKHRALPDWDTTDYSVRSWILMRNRHHLFVQEYFADRPDDLLIVNFVSDPSAGTRVANFLGFPGNFDRPVENVNPDKQVPASHAEMLSRVSTELGIPAHELKYDIYCPSLLGSGSRARFPVDSRAQSELQKLSAQSDSPAVA